MEADLRGGYADAKAHRPQRPRIDPRVDARQTPSVTETMPLPQASGETFLTDGGLETVLIYEHGIELPDFAAFPLVRSDHGRDLLRTYYAPYLDIASRHGAGFLLGTPTWRASADWGERLGYSPGDLAAVNLESAAFLREVRDTRHDSSRILVEGVIGPRGDGYAAAEAMTAERAEAYHLPQIESLAEGGVDLVCAMTLTYAREAVGIVRAAGRVGIPVAVSFTVETDGRLPSGQGLRAAIEQVDAETAGAASYLGVNCAHPTHFRHVLEGDGAWLGRLRSVRANASRRSHAELDAMDELDAGDPDELGAAYRELREHLPALCVVGGCCGTDQRHVEAIAAAQPMR
jgi:S-methylmethionine-dependent homocysteine/selenocysteine methylase